MYKHINTEVLFSATKNNRFVVWDAMMGSGKTQTIIEYMIKESNKIVFGASPEKFIYISPYLSEAHRIAGTEAIIGDDTKRPRKVKQGDAQYEDALLLSDVMPTFYNLDLPQSTLSFCHPSNQNSDGSKELGFKHLVENGANIVSTHNLFKMLSIAKDLGLDLSAYTLVIDECLDTLEVDQTFTKTELTRWFNNNILSLNEDGVTVHFHKENFGRVQEDEDTTEGTRYEYIANACNKGLVYKFGNRLVTKFDASILSLFKKTIIMTYNYKGSMFDLTLQQQGINPHVEHFGTTVQDIKHLININQDRKMNSVGVPRNPKTMVADGKYKVLTSTYYKADANGTKAVAYPNICNFFYNKLFNLWMQKDKVPVERRLWTCFKNDSVAIGKGSQRSNRFGASWIPFNTKATNDYDNADHLAFLVNVYMQPDFVKCASHNGFNFSQDHYALNILVQWLFRSAIRKDQPIDLYIPCLRMRTLLEEWLDGKVITYATNKEEMKSYD